MNKSKLQKLLAVLLGLALALALAHALAADGTVPSDDEGEPLVIMNTDRDPSPSKVMTSLPPSS